MVELLAPAGNFTKLKTAFYFGADACYLGGKLFSLRSLSDNFTEEELDSATKLAHSLGKKVYVTVNIFAKNADFGALSAFAETLERIGVDAVLVSDPGVIYLFKKVAPKLTIHLSTQANTTNAMAVRFWKEQGLSRVVLARELSLNEIREIHEQVPDIELEAFVHGAMCISYSGRCLLSDYLDGRASNRGACVQACRWKYDIRKSGVGEDGGYLGVEETDRGTFFMNSKDLNMAKFLKEMQDAGVVSFKIEGRMKSEYYLATVVNAYRRAIDGGYSNLVEEELLAAAHRDYTTAYMLGENKKTVNYSDSQSKGTCEFIGTVVGREGDYALVEMRNRFYSTDTLEILTPGTMRSFTVGTMLLPDGTETDDAKLVQGIYRVKTDASVGDVLRRRK
ncbi:MAG: U32 family peptidase [Clostridia bacterium]|nr:U32 family peptidase [Clostridia bacterium]